MIPKKKICYLCKEEQFIWKNDEGKRYCKSCWLKKSATIAKIKPTKQYKIPSRSSKRGKEERLYASLRKNFLLSYPQCQAQIPGQCTHQSTEVHHKKGRVGNLLIDVSKFLAVCRNCHEWIENHTPEAQKLGFSINKIK